MKRYAAVLFGLSCLLSAGFVTAGQQTDGRSGAMGGAYGSLAQGAEGMWWNPAVLGSAKLVSVEVGGGLEAGNNALSLTQMSGIATDDAGKKAEAVQAIRDHGRWDAVVQGGGGMAVSVWRVGVLYAPQAFIRADDVSPDAAEFALNGTIPLVLGKTYDIHGSYTRALYAELGAGYAHEFLSLIPGMTLRAGAAVKLLKGSDYDHLTLNQSFVAGSPIPPASQSTHDFASSGSGAAVDLGIHAKMLGGIVQASVVARNLGAKLTWDATRETGSFNQSTLSYNYTATTGDAVLTLPSNLQAAASATLPGVGTSVAAMLDVQSNPSATRVRVGAEQSIVGVIAFRGGYASAAGASPALVTLGLGLGTPSVLPLTFRVDVAGGIALDGKGGSAGISAYAAF